MTLTGADSGRYAMDSGSLGGNTNKRHMNEYRDLENSVFIELEDELLADETPDVTIVPNGVEDAAGNEQDDGDHEADDWISPKFTVVSITSTLETAQDQILAGDGDEDYGSGYFRRAPGLDAPDGYGYLCERACRQR